MLWNVGWYMDLSTPTAALPSGWVTYHDADGMTYYVESDTGVRVWEQ